ncbi:MAG: lysophospholipid acyltransferase family protein [candidate division KSB1 bacterium]|nr:lysophospholipid acyltransferase family protein [candidate division KSB1 bacterium]
MSLLWRRTRKRIKNWLIYIFVKAGLRWINSAARDTAIKFLKNLALFGFYLIGSERRKTIDHLTLIYGSHYDQKTIYRMARAVFINLGRNMADAFRLPCYGSHNIDRYVTAWGLEKLDRALARGRGVLAITGHIGNWELMGAYLAIKGYPVNVVGAPIYDPRLDALVVSNRERSGMKYIARGGATREILRALARNEIIGLLIDQDTRHVDGVFIDFLGKLAYTPVGPTILALKTQAAVVPMAIHIGPDNRHYIEIGDQLDLEISGDASQDRVTNTQRFSDAIAQVIQKYPTQWVWMHQRWKTKPEDVASKDLH